MAHTLYDRPSLRLRRPISSVRDGEYQVLRWKWVSKPGWDHRVSVFLVDTINGERGWIDPPEEKS